MRGSFLDYGGGGGGRRHVVVVVVVVEVIVVFAAVVAVVARVAVARSLLIASLLSIRSKVVTNWPHCFFPVCSNNSNDNTIVSSRDCGNKVVINICIPLNNRQGYDN